MQSYHVFYRSDQLDQIHTDRTVFATFKTPSKYGDPHPADLRTCQIVAPATPRGRCRWAKSSSACSPALRGYLLSPDVVASAVEAYQHERNRLAEERRRSRHKLEAAAAEVERRTTRLLTLVENGHADPVATGPRINELLVERWRLADALSQQPASNVVEFFPKAAERYRQKVDIHAALGRGEEGDPVALVRSLIGRIVVHAAQAPEPLGLEVEGSLAALMADAQSWNIPT